MTSIDDMASEIMKGLTEYAELADAEMKKAVRKTATAVKNEISANAPKKSGRYQKSWAAKKVKENSHTLEMTVHSKNRYQIAHLLEHGHAKAPTRRLMITGTALCISRLRQPTTAPAHVRQVPQRAAAQPQQPLLTDSEEKEYGYQENHHC